MLNNKVRSAANIPSNRNFGYTFAGFFVLLSIAKIYNGNLQDIKPLLLCSVSFVLITIFAPSMLLPLNRVWAQVGVILHRVATPIIMGLLFYLVITPIGVAMRLFGWDPLRLKYDLQAQSYWLNRKDSKVKSGTMNNQF